MAATQSSIDQLGEDISLNPARAPLFLCILCMAGKDLSATQNIPEDDSIFNVFVLKNTNFVLLAPSQGGKPHLLPFSTFSTLILTKFSQSILPAKKDTIQVLITESGNFKFLKYNTEKQEKFEILSNICIQDIKQIFVQISSKENVILTQLRSLNKLNNVTGRRKRNLLDVFFGPSTTSIRDKGIKQGPILAFTHPLATAIF
jgi:hypothetical protein